MRVHRNFFSVLLLMLWLPVLAPQARAQQQVTLGDASALLTGPWKFHIGDNMAWAQPGFDDSAWGTMDLTPPPGSYDPALGGSGFVPGWTASGYKGYSGYAWYRLRVDIHDGPVHEGQSALALKMPDDVDDAYQVYVDGRYIGGFGRFTARGVTAYQTMPRAFPLPAQIRSGPATVAIRMYMLPSTLQISPEAGGLHGPPVLGQRSAVDALLHVDWDSIDREFYSLFLELPLQLLAVLVAFSLYRLDRGEPAYLWLGLTSTAILALVASDIVAEYTTWIDGVNQVLLQDTVLLPAVVGLWVIFWATWFRLEGMARLHRMVWSIVVVLGIGTALLRAPLYGTVIPAHAIIWLSPLRLFLRLLLGGLLVWVTVRGIRKDRAGGLTAMSAVLLVFLALYGNDLYVLGVPAIFFPYGIGITLGQAGITLSSIVITVLLLWRFLRSQREREQWRLEIEQARQVQQMLIPEQLPATPGLMIESEYRPAHVVGGDFFQILPDRRDGSVLIVAGDVTGHGLQAGMLVALLVGAIRTVTDTSFDPLLLLQTLNQRLCGRGHAHATCLALHITADGAATLANAGHLPPYLNSTELPMEGAILLGMIEDAEFSVMHFELQPGDTLMLLSDGIAEAQDAQGQLFGFERIEAMLRGATPRQAVNAADIAIAAQKFGQHDDISVLSVTRTRPSYAGFA
jgi:hypothetical protein